MCRVGGDSLRTETISPGATAQVFFSISCVAISRSPDGLRIAFDSHRQGNTQIYITDLGGSGHMPITTNAWNDMMPSWSR